MTETKACLTCQLTAQRDHGTAPLWDSIYRSQFWDVVHMGIFMWFGAWPTNPKIGGVSISLAI